MYDCSADTSMGRIWPGTLVANATMPDPPSAVYSVMKRLPPATARFTAPNMPLAPALPDAAVSSWTGPVIHESSPPCATIDSPASSCISSTGIVVPITLWSISVSCREVGASAVDGASTHHPMSGIVIGERAVVGARFVPHRDVAFGPVPAHAEVRVLDMTTEEPQQRVALVAAHADDLVHEPARDEERASAGDGMGAHERMLDGRERGHDALGDLLTHVARHPLVEVGAGVVSH